MHWLLLVANTLTAEPTLIAKFETEASCKQAQQELGNVIAAMQNQSLDLNSGDGPSLSCKAPLKATELP